jgi:hypothetical protein
MPNSNYAQVSSLLAQGKLHWQTDAISAALLTGATFDASHKVISEAGGSVVGTAPITGRALGDDGSALGQPVIFANADAGTVYQLVLIQSNGVGEPLLLAWIDETIQEEDENTDITVAQDGTLIIRPVEYDSTPAPDGSVLPPQVGVWMNL